MDLSRQLIIFGANYEVRQTMVSAFAGWEGGAGRIVCFTWVRKFHAFGVKLKQNWTQADAMRQDADFYFDGVRKKIGAAAGM